MHTNTQNVFYPCQKLLVQFCLECFYVVAESLLELSHTSGRSSKDFRLDLNATCQGLSEFSGSSLTPTDTERLESLIISSLVFPLRHEHTGLPTSFIDIEYNVLWVSSGHGGDSCFIRVLLF